MNINKQNIPRNWSIKKLGEIFKLSAGGDVDRSLFAEKQDAGHLYPIFANALTNQGLYGYSSDYRVEEESVTITGRGDIGKVFYREGKYTPIVRLIVGIPKKNISAKYMSYACSRIHFFNETTGVPQLTVPQVSWYKIAVPPFAEQKKIAEILGTWDRAIEELTDLIAEKKELKRGLMQRLLTGTQRLPGVTKPWKKDFLSNLCDIETGKKDVNEGNPAGQYPFFTCAKTHTFADTFSYDKEAILIAGNGDVGNCQYYNGKFEAYQRTYILSNFRTDVRLLFQILDTKMSRYAESQKQQGAMPYIKLSALTDFIVYMPEDFAEQKAIADVLSKADAEIDLLNLRLDVLKEQKRGLMQKLLTGEIRVKVDKE